MWNNILSFRPKPVDWIFSFKTFGAAMLALYIGLAFDLERPVWAMATVYIVANPMSGMQASRAMYRILGTILGAVVSIVLVPNLVNAPVVLSLALALWVGMCIFVSRLDRRPRSYVLLLAGYTAALIGFPSVTDPITVFSTAIARCQEISIGIICATLVGHIVFPRHIGPVVAAKTQGWMDDVTKLVTESFNPDMDATQLDEDRAKLAADLGELHDMAMHLGYEKSRFSGRTRQLHALQSATAALLPVCYAIHDRLSAIKGQGVELPAQLSGLCADIVDHVKSETHDPEQLDNLHRKIHAYRDTIGDVEIWETPEDNKSDQTSQADNGKTSTWVLLLQVNLCERLHRFLDFHHDCRVLWDGIRSGDAPTDVVNRWRAVAGEEARHVDAGIAFRSGLVGVCAILTVCAFWVLSGWPSGGTAAMMAAVGSSIMSFLDNPVPALRGFIRYTSMAVGGVIFYSLVIMPGIDGFPLLALSFAPYCILLGVLMTSPATFGFGLAMIVNLVMILNIGTTFTSDIETLLGGGVASVGGFAVAALFTAFLRVVPVDRSIMRLVRGNWRDIASIARGSFAHGRIVLVRRLLDRQGLILPRLAMAPQFRDTLIRVMPEVSIAASLYDLRRVMFLVDQRLRLRIQVLLRSIARHFDLRLEDPERLPDASIVAEVDNILRLAMNVTSGAERERVLVPLIALRRTLSKDGAPKLHSTSGAGQAPGQPVIMGETA
ncbi:FUSC family protein [Thalassospira sp. MA62]|nr:FUSC family protein [Thalassospira sp. MA62]